MKTSKSGKIAVKLLVSEELHARIKAVSKGEDRSMSLQIPRLLVYALDALYPKISGNTGREQPQINGAERVYDNGAPMRYWPDGREKTWEECVQTC